MSDIAIQVKNVSKNFLLPHEKSATLKSKILNPFRSKNVERQKALDSISFEIKKGEFFGIVGRNGSGKSTLLKCLAGVYTPDSGSISVDGTLVPFIELGVGFNPELSGRENVYLNGSLLGFSRKEIDAMYEDIVAFAELERFMDQALKNYSSGMQVRLAFSIAIQAKGDILLLDEVLAVGDAAFQQKCFDYFEELKNKNKTVILVSHDKNSMERYCEKGILINDGNIIESGPIKDILKSYNAVILEELNKDNKYDIERNETSKSIGGAKILSTTVVCLDKNDRKSFDISDKLIVKFDVKVTETLVNPILGVTIWQKNVTKPVYAANTLTQGSKKTGEFKVGSIITFSTELPPGLNNGEYYVDVAIANETTTLTYDQKQDAARFSIYGSENPYSIIQTNGKIKISRSI